MQYLWCFLVGGAICALSQIVINKTAITPARTMVSLVVIGAVLSYLGLYQPLIDFAGAGASIPITGFGHLLTKGVIKAIEEQGALGIITGGLKATATGISAAVFLGFLYSLVSRSKPKA